MLIQFNHEIVYNITDRPDAEDVAITILSNRRLIHEAALLLELLFDDLKISNAKVELIQASQNSPLREIYLAAILVTFQESIQRDVPKIITGITGVKMPEHYGTLLSFIALTIAYYSIGAAINIVRNGANGLLTNRKYKQLLKMVSDQMGLPEERIQRALDKALQGKRRSGVIRSAVNLFRPAKREDGKSVIVAGRLEIDRKTVLEIPDIHQLEVAHPEDHAEPLENVEVRFEAQDKGRLKLGWAGTIPAVSDDRLRMTIYPPLRAEELFLRPSVQGDVILVSKRQDDGSYKPYLFHLVRVRE